MGLNISAYSGTEQNMKDSLLVDLGQKLLGYFFHLLLYSTYS